jgi:hypothetical protein
MLASEPRGVGSVPGFRISSAQVRSRSNVLDAIRCSEVNVAVWRRSLDVDLREEMARFLARPPLPWFDRDAVSARELSELGPRLLGGSGVAFQEDLRRLGERFLALAGAGDCRVGFGRILTDKCRKFHADYVRLRMVVTYEGPGTEWVPDGAVARERTIEPHPDPAVANRQIVRDATAVGRARTGDVVLLKGHGWPGNEGRGAIHRSPPIEDAGAAPVVLVLSVS